MTIEKISIVCADQSKTTKDFYKVFVEQDHSGECKLKKSSFLRFLTTNTINKINSFFAISDFQKENYLDTIEKSLETPESIGELWKHLLIDAIYFLRINDTREDLYYTDRSNQIRTNITDSHVATAAWPNTFGIDDLYSYFEQFTAFESILYGTDKFYRDHIIHPINVWILGLHIIENFGLTFKVLACRDIKILNEKESNTEEELTITIAEITAMWTIVSLTHDIGYPLEKVEKINDQLERMLNKFGKIRFNRSDFSFENRHDNLVNFLIDFISAVAKSDPEQKAGNTENPQWLIHKRWKYWSKFSKSWEAYDHGIVSSLILLKSLTFFIEADYADNSKLSSIEDVRQFAIRSEILHTIAAHTTPKIYHLRTSNLPFLLVLCDEMQEWSRPTFSDIKAGARGRANKIEIKHFGIKDGLTRINFCVSYEEVSYKSQKEIVKKIFLKWYERLRYALDDKERNLQFTWQVQFGKYLWDFVFDSTKKTYEVVTIKVPNQTSGFQDDKDIGFLVESDQ